MHDPAQPSSSRLMPVLGLLMAMAVTPVLADSDEAAAPLTGQEVYNNVCIACHSPPGAGGAPPLGDAEAWGPRIAQGMETLFEHALNGFSGETGIMPKKGERPDLSDEEIMGAVEYMVGQVDQ